MKPSLLKPLHTLSPLHSTAVILAIVNAVAGISLLLLSGWFIAASALAGLSTTAVLFNYLVPAGAIRMLALTRIASGYGEKAVGHHSLLERLHQLRLSWFTRILNQRESQALRAEQAEHLNQTVEDSANLWLTVIHPNIANLFILLLSSGLLCWLAPHSLPLWFGLQLLNLLLCGWLWVLHKRAEQQREVTQNSYRTELEHHLNAAPLWLLSSTLEAGGTMTQKAKLWLTSLGRRRQTEALGESLLTLFSGLTLIALLLWLPPEHYGSALLMLPVIALLSLPEWAGNTLRSIRQAIATQQARRHLPATAQKQEQIQVKSSTHSLTIDQLQLSNYGWQYPQEAAYTTHAVNATLNAGELIWLKGGSGSGKSSLLMALAGLIQEQGELGLSPAPPCDMTIEQRQQLIHYVEQFPYVLSDTLRENLLLAQPQASEERLAEALAFSELTPLTPQLEQWVGESGRSLSGGEIKRLGIARAYLQNAPIWLLDEPFEGVDPKRQVLLLEKLQQLAHNQNRLIVVASHLWPQSVLADQVIHLD